ncbi:MAG: ribbon-helix-helix protein, CopG family [Actinomycetes bacterium]
MSRGEQGRADDAVVAEQVRLAREEYAEEEAEAAELETAQNAAALEVSLSLRISREMDASLRRRATAEQVSPSALVRRLLRKGLQSGDEPVLTAHQVEEIARRVLRESA